MNNMELLMQYITYVLLAIGGMAFLVGGITQAIKDMPKLCKIQTNVVAICVSLILCPVVVVVICQYFKIVIEWYYIFASFVAAFFVYLVATSGWERLAEIWKRTRYNKQ